MEGAPILLNVLDDQLGAFVMAHEGGHLGIVHRICQVADEDALNFPAGHLADAE